MELYLLSQTPLIVGLFLLVGLASARPWKEDERLSVWIALASILGAMYFFAQLPEGAVYFGGAIQVTAPGRAFGLIALGLIALALFVSEGYLQKVHIHPIDWRSLQVILALGAANLALAGDLATLFVSFEIVSILSYAAVAMSRFDPRSNEAGLKYLILGILGSALFLFGISFLFGATGEIRLDAIQAKLAEAGPGELLLARFALGMFLGAIFFKIAAVPFHGWLLDVYQGGSFAALGIIAAPVKAAVYGMLFALLHGPFAALDDIWRPTLAIAATLSFAVGGIQGLFQTNLKRILACSAVANTGFILLAIAYAPAWAVLLYVLVYGAMTLALLAFWMSLGARNADLDDLADLQGLGRFHSWLAVGLTIVLLSYGGLPPTAGFAAKFAVLFSAFQAASAGSYLAGVAAATGAAGSALTIYFYFQMVRRIWFREGASGNDFERDRRWNYLAVAGAGALFVLIGYLPFFFYVG